MNFRTLKQLAELAETRNLSLGQLMLEEQCHESGEDTGTVFGQMQEYYEIMKSAVHQGLHTDTTSKSGLTGGDARKLMAFRADGQSMLGDHASLSMSYALAVSEVNASMGRIIATPTAGSCGIIPGYLSAARSDSAGPMNRWSTACSPPGQSVTSLPTIRSSLVRKAGVKRKWGQPSGWQLERW